MSKKGMLAFDIDGTLTHQLDNIDPKVVQTLEKLVADGWTIALVTGRIFSFSWKILRHLHFPYYLAVQNGADILQMPGKKILKQCYLGRDILPHIEQAYQGEKEDFIIYAGVEKGDYCYYRVGNFSAKMLKYLKTLESLGERPWQISDFVFPKGFTFPLIKCFGPEKEMEKLHGEFKQNPALEVSLILDPVDRSLHLNLITHPEANKGNAVRYLRHMLQPPLVIAAGDDRNDYKMLMEADIRIVMETAPTDVLECADIRAKPARDLGIIDAIHKAIR